MGAGQLSELAHLVCSVCHQDATHTASLVLWRSHIDLSQELARSPTGTTTS